MHAQIVYRGQRVIPATGNVGGSAWISSTIKVSLMLLIMSTSLMPWKEAADEAPRSDGLRAFVSDPVA